MNLGSINLDAGYTLKLALEIDPASCKNSCRYRIFGTNCDEVNVNKALQTGQCTNELLLKQEKEAIEKQIGGGSSLFQPPVSTPSR